MPGTLEHKDGLIDRYLNNKLNDVERAAFEIMMLEDEQLFARVQLLDAFKNSLNDESSALTAKRELLALPFRAWLQQPLSLAASVLVVGLGLQLAYDAFIPDAAAPGALGIDSVVLLEATRGARRPELSGAPPYLFQVDAGFDAANTEVSVSLRSADGVELLRADALQVDPNGWARLVYDQPLSGDYTLELVVAAEPAVTRTFELTIND
jgi:hypothetical protein